jgi:hypothetical protein
MAETHKAQEGASGGEWDARTSGDTSVDMCKQDEAIKRHVVIS